MKTSAQGRRLIEIWEEGGRAKLTPYDDGTGTLTIGYGHTSAAGPPRVGVGTRITAREADQILFDDLGKVENDINKLVKVPLNQNQFDALVSFQFNTGALGISTLLNKLNAGNYASVRTELLKWTIGGGAEMPGLVKRRKSEINLFYGKGIEVTTPPVVLVETKSIWQSKIFWTQIIAVATSVATVASGGKLNFPPEVQAVIVTAIEGVAGLLTIILKNYYTPTITPDSAAKIGA